MRLTPPSRRSPTCCNKPAENGQSGRLCEKPAAFSISKGLHPSQSDTEMSLPRKRHFTQTKPAFPVRSILHSAKGRIPPRRPDRASFRDAVSSRFRLPRRARKMRPPRNDKSGRFCWKTKRFPERKVSNFCGAILRKNNRQNEKRPFSKLKRSNLCHCEAASRPWQSLSRRYGIPWRSTGVRSKREALSQKTWDSPLHSAFSLFLPRFCFVPRIHISLRDDKSHC